jgi:hypothetical protein
MTLTQEIGVSSVFPVTEILTIENHQLDITFLYVTFRSQSLLKPTGDQTDSDTNWKTRKGDQRGWMRANQNYSRKLGLYPEIDLRLISSNLDKTV